ncbi:5-methyltetrahydropteroyltriglutamate--homocysteine S-methyltransferase [Parasphaerochaeta coccoides]|uniref:5-methyltetrahydropteroyltriglutamate--homocysteine methyltransferase n=1 Tax=Parasphaerochaeta coccoides (strain ATCC BAA-1237 / DSM 17374 / SPN1) TaxID=760011 RepID=F4GJ90_PARC1|nr:5-methyltetrahydropteroyltriglutamate--homocysteine S-methyltransferase [Parasphaerochaeta coccoides]AEC01730.1 methionine synthase (B12-independent) [Parasphaerochaeta coccoides DSM 17374]
MKISVVGYPRIGADRELKHISEQFFKKDVTATELMAAGAAIRKEQWLFQKESGVDLIPSNDFSFYDTVLDTAVLFNLVPHRYRELELEPLDTYFAMARGYQGKKGDVKALSMKKWFNTNYHYLVPEIEDDTHITVTGTKPFDEFLEARQAGVHTKPVLLGPFTLLKLARFTGSKTVDDVKEDIVTAYREVLTRLNSLDATWIQYDEPALVRDLTEDDLYLFHELYDGILSAKGSSKILLQTYFGDIRDIYGTAPLQKFDGVGIDFVEGSQSLELVAAKGFPEDTILFAGLVNGKNIWRNDYEKSLYLLGKLQEKTTSIVLSTSCSLLHVPYSVKAETKLPSDYIAHFAFAQEKICELAELRDIFDNAGREHPAFIRNRQLFSQKREGSNPAVQDRVGAISGKDYIREPAFVERERIQKARFHFPLLPTTTIGSFPQTFDVRRNRSQFKKELISEEQYKDFNKKKIADCIALQEEIGLDILVHGEYERNDMVEYFGECLDGFLFTEKAWVQSYGTRCVKPPIIWGDVSRTRPITVEYSVFAQSCTDKTVKGMLTGPVTILNWSFPREDISLKESTLQIALAIRDEVLDLERNGISIIQVDEAALREKLPLRKSDWFTEYLDWAIPAFRLVHSNLKAETQLHTHMCYSEFSDIIRSIDDMDADVITFEASRSDLTILTALKDAGFRTEVGPGVYDIHSPRVPSVAEIKNALGSMLATVPVEKLWVNPDCGLKTRGTEETISSLRHLVQAARELRTVL